MNVRSDNYGIENNTTCCGQWASHNNVLPIHDILHTFSTYSDDNINKRNTIKSIESYNFSLIHEKFKINPVIVAKSFDDEKYTKRTMYKSKQTLYFSDDNKYIIKTLSRTEVNILLEILPKYVDYILNNHTYLLQILGLFKIKFNTYCILFVNSCNGVIANYAYDLKGREKKLDKINQEYDNGIIDDNNFNCKFTIDSQKILNILNNDALFLKNNKLMDYSLLILEYKHKDKNSVDLIEAIKEESIDNTMCESNCYLSFTFIDFLNRYNYKKRIAHFFKTFKYNENQIASVNSELYYGRIYHFLLQKIS
jgi:hypothetical protein